MEISLTFCQYPLYPWVGIDDAETVCCPGSAQRWLGSELELLTDGWNWLMFKTGGAVVLQ